MKQRSSIKTHAAIDMCFDDVQWLDDDTTKPHATYWKHVALGQQTFLNSQSYAFQTISP